MTSPLMPYAYSYLLITATGAPSVVNGRIVMAEGSKYLVQCYFSRQDSSGVTTGADYYPTKGSPGETLPGASGQVYLYRGYGLQYVQVIDGYELGEDVIPVTGWATLVSSDVPDWLYDGVECECLHGNEAAKYAKIEKMSGKYGGLGIDQIISASIQGIPLTITCGELVS